MKLRKLFLSGICLMALCLGFSSCESDDDDWKEGAKVELSGNRAFILNEGSKGNNNANLIYFDWSKGTFYNSCIYAAQNGKALGDVGNDMIAYDGKILVTINVSNYVALLNGSGVELDRISFAQYPNLGQIRNVAADDDYAYCTSYGGYVSKIKINGSELEYVDSVYIGSYPEGVVVEDDKVYCAVSGWGADNRVAVIDANKFSTADYITVMSNPDILAEEDGKVFVQGYGEYDANWNATYPWGVLENGKFTQIGTANYIAAENGKVYTAYTKANWATRTYVSTFATYDISSGTLNESFFKSVPSDLAASAVYSISVNPYNGDIYIGTSDYSTDGTIYKFDEDGNYLTSFSSNGVNPNKIVFLKN